MGRKSGLGGYITPESTTRGGKKGGGDNPRHPDADYLVRGGEQQGREFRAQSAITTARRVNPDNPEMANKNVNMVGDYTKQLSIVPVFKDRGLSRMNAPYRTMNEDGKAAVALPDIVVGAGEDDPGVTGSMSGRK